MNWGYKLMITFVVFASMMGYLVYKCYGTNFELVEAEYYKSELKYQEVIDGTNNANSLAAAPVLRQVGNDVTLQMPAETKTGALSGSVLFYCPSNSKNDRRFELKPDKSAVQSFNRTVLPGRYVVKIEWIGNGKKYYSEQNLTVLHQ